MYNVDEEMIENLREMLTSRGINAEEYTEAQLSSMIQQAVTLIGEEYVSSRTEVDYDYTFTGDIYLTAEYPITPEAVTVTLDDVDITDSIKSITKEGVIHFNEDHDGVLRVEYNVGLTSDVVQDSILLAAMYLLGDSAHMGNISSINEGDVSISYDRTNNTANSLDGVINNVHKQFGARVKMI